MAPAVGGVQFGNMITLRGPSLPETSMPFDKRSKWFIMHMPLTFVFLNRVNCAASFRLLQENIIIKGT